MDLYGLEASQLPPELVARLAGAQTQRQVADALMKQSMQPLQAPESKGRFQGVISPLEAIAKLVQGEAARQNIGASDKVVQSILQQQQKGREDAMAQYVKMRDGSPGVKPMVPNDDEGNPMPVLPPTPADRAGAAAWAMTNPYLRGNPVIAQDIKSSEPKWEVKEIFTPDGKKSHALVDLNNPGRVVPFGGSEVKMHQVTVAGADGTPETRFVPESTQEPLKQPVKMEMKDTGKVIVPVNPYKPEVGYGKTTTPGEDQSRQTQLQIHGLGPDGTPTGEIKEVAKAIGEGRLPPLSSMAMSSVRGQQIMGELAKNFPGYDVKDFHSADTGLKYFTSGKGGQQVRSFNVALAHLDTLDQLATALGNNDSQLINKVGNAVSTQMGVPNVTNFEAAKKIVGDEIVKAIVGSGGGVADREEAARTISAASSPAQLKGVINTYRELMRGQLGGLRQQYETTTGRKDFDRFLSEEGKVRAHQGESGPSWRVER